MAISKSVDPVPTKAPIARKPAAGKAAKSPVKGAEAPAKKAAPKAAAAKAPAKAAKPEKAPAKKAAPLKPQASLPELHAPELRHRMVSEAAYYLAERRGFSGGDPFHDWVSAEAEIDRLYFGKS